MLAFVIAPATAQAATVGCVGDTSAITSHSFIITEPDGSSRTVSSLNGQLSGGERVTATVTANPACQTVDVSLASYNMKYQAGQVPSLVFWQGQTLYQGATITLAGGSSGTLTVL